ncbi:MAG: amidohydrolase [Clostridia bacterium]|nr:amidohydrolase [Clostridia bacterium]
MQYKDYEIIDFHTHPFILEKNNICAHASHCGMSAERTLATFDGLGITRFCGSVLSIGSARADYATPWEQNLAENRIALALWETYGDRYIPGFHVHPDYVEESIEEMHKMHGKGIRLIGELCPYRYDWKDYSCDGLSVILDEAERLDMIVSFHSMGEDEMDRMVKNHPNLILVAAHPGEYSAFMRHLDRMKMSENYYLDLSGYGLFRHGMLRRAIDEMGAERFLFGSDFPTCSPAMYIGGVLLDELITDEEKTAILSKNAKRLLGL